MIIMRIGLKHNHGKHDAWRKNETWSRLPFSLDSNLCLPVPLAIQAHVLDHVSTLGLSFESYMEGNKSTISFVRL